MSSCRVPTQRWPYRTASRSEWRSHREIPSSSTGLSSCLPATADSLCCPPILRSPFSGPKSTRSPSSQSTHPTSLRLGSLPFSCSLVDQMLFIPVFNSRSSILMRYQPCPNLDSQFLFTCCLGLTCLWILSCFSNLWDRILLSVHIFANVSISRSRMIWNRILLRLFVVGVDWLSGFLVALNFSITRLVFQLAWCKFLHRCCDEWTWLLCV